MAEKQATKKNSLQTRWASFQSLSPQDKRRTVIDVLFNNAMYIIIVLAIIYIAIRVPQFLSMSSLINIVSLTAAKLPIALGICGVLIGTLIGDKAASKINAELMKKLIYLFLALSGVISILETLLR